MSSLRVRNILLVVTLLVVLPVASEAAGLISTSSERSVWTMVWTWLSDLWSGQVPQLDAPSGTAFLGSADSAPPTPSTSGSSGPTTCSADQGVCIDPNG